MPKHTRTGAANIKRPRFRFAVIGSGFFIRQPEPVRDWILDLVNLSVGCTESGPLWRQGTVLLPRCAELHGEANGSRIV